MSGLQLFEAIRNNPPVKVRPVNNSAENWTRRGIAEWLLTHFKSNERIIVGIDHAFSFPVSIFEEYDLFNWEEFLEHFCKLWPTHREGIKVNDLRQINPPYEEQNELRLTEKWTSSANSVFRFGVPGQVAPASHAGIPWLKVIRDNCKNLVHFWPFDGFEIEVGRSVIAEVYPSIFRNRYENENRSSDEHDAYAIARWLSEMDQHGFLTNYFTLPLTGEEKNIAKLEGWILGIT